MSPQGISSPKDQDWFRVQVWAVVQQVPPGKVITYGQVAGLVSPPSGMTPEHYRAFAPRWVGGAMAACPPGIPWQRVVNSQGRVSLPGEAGLTQRALLEAEGVLFSASGKIDLKRFGWMPDQQGQLSLF